MVYRKYDQPMWWQGLQKRCFSFSLCKNIKTRANLSHSNDDDWYSFRCVKLFFSRHFLVHYVVFLFYFFWERSGGGQGNRHNALHAVLLLYLITGCFMIMLLYVLRLTSLFMCHVFAIKKALISSFTCPVATHTKCEMRNVLSVVCRWCCVCSVNSCFCSLCLLYIFNMHAVLRMCRMYSYAPKHLNNDCCVQSAFFYLHVRTFDYMWHLNQFFPSFFCWCASSVFFGSCEYIQISSTIWLVSSLSYLHTSQNSIWNAFQLKKMCLPNDARSFVRYVCIPQFWHILWK